MEQTECSETSAYKI